MHCIASNYILKSYCHMFIAFSQQAESKDPNSIPSTSLTKTINEDFSII